MVDVGPEALDLLEVPDVAARLKVSEKTVRRLVASGELLSVKIGARRLIAPEDVIAYKGKLRGIAPAA